jgi:hypothetical protein
MGKTPWTGSLEVDTEMIFSSLFGLGADKVKKIHQNSLEN